MNYYEKLKAKLAECLRLLIKHKEEEGEGYHEIPLDKWPRHRMCDLPEETPKPLYAIEENRFPLANPGPRHMQAPGHLCPECFHQFKKPVVLGGTKPGPGDYMLCFQCGTISCYCEDGVTLRHTTPDEQPPPLQAMAEDIRGDNN